MNNKIHYSDIFVLQSMFFPNTTQVILFGDKENLNAYSDDSKVTKVNALEQFIAEIKKQEEPVAVFNFGNASLSQYTKDTVVEGIINFAPATKNSYTQAFSYINNPDSTMRWIYPSKSKSPVFIHFYNNTGIKAKTFKSAAKVLSKVGGLRMLSNGYFTIDCKEDCLPEAEDYAYFTGTAGQDRKAILACHSKGACTHFIKMPVGEQAQQLVLNEYKQLQSLQFMKFKSMVVPKVKRIDHGVQVSNIKPAHFIDETGIQDVHLNALDELYKQHTGTKKVVQTSAWKDILEALDFFETMPSLNNGLSTEKVNDLIAYCKQTAYALQEESVVTGWSHGDFTPWNMYVTKDKLHLYDWELSKKDMPLLVDIIHYVFQKNSLIDRAGFDVIQHELKALAFKNTKLKTMLYKLNIRWNTHYAFYLLYIVCYYLPRYAQQEDLHEQAHWLVDTWLEAMKAMSVQTGATQTSH